MTDNQVFLLITSALGLLALLVILVFMKEPREALLDRDNWKFPSIIQVLIFLGTIIGFGAFALLIAIVEVIWDFKSRRKK